MEPYLRSHVEAGYVEYLPRWPLEPNEMRERLDPFCTIFLNFDRCLFESRGRAEHLLLLKAPDQFLYSPAGHASLTTWLRSTYRQPLRSSLCALAIRRIEFGTSSVQKSGMNVSGAVSPIDIFLHRESEAQPTWVHSGVLMRPELAIYADNARAVCRERSWSAEIDAHDWVLNHYFEFMSEDALVEKGGGRRCEQCDIYDDGLFRSHTLHDVRWELQRKRLEQGDLTRLSEQQLVSWRSATKAALVSASVAFSITADPNESSLLHENGRGIVSR